MDERIKKLIAIGASLAANCHPCLEYHIGRALESGIERKEIQEAIDVARKVRGGATASMDALALKLRDGDASDAVCGNRESSGCCS